MIHGHLYSRSRPRSKRVGIFIAPNCTCKDPEDSVYIPKTNFNKGGMMVRRLLFAVAILSSTWAVSDQAQAFHGFRSQRCGGGYGVPAAAYYPQYAHPTYYNSRSISAGYRGYPGYGAGAYRGLGRPSYGYSGYGYPGFGTRGLSIGIGSGMGYGSGLGYGGFGPGLGYGW